VTQSPIRILVVNPNISESVSTLIGDEARLAAAPDTSITMLTAPFGVAYIETRFEALIGAYATANVVAENIAGHDAVVVAAFGDPGVPGLREVLDVPVVGMAEAALASISLLGHRFSIIAISRRITAWYRESVEQAGLIGRLASIRSLDEPLRDIGNVQGDHAARLRELCAAVVKEDGADAIIFGGAPLAGLARQIAGDISVPVVDGVSSAVKHAETLVRLKPGSARGGSFAPPPQKPNAGLPEPLRDLLQRGWQRGA
jgi:allantoin racemase